MSFRLVPKSVTLNDLERHNGHCQVTRTEMNRDAWLSIRIDILVGSLLHNINDSVVVDSFDKFSNIFLRVHLN